MRIHFMFEPDSPERLRELGLHAERLGFEAVWLPNILSTRDPFIALAPLARDSRALRVGPVAISPFEMHPAKMANAILSLNELARGRAGLVVGGGGGTLIALNLKPDRQSRHPRMVRGVQECLEFLRAAATGKPVDFHGQLYRVDGYRAAWAAGPAPRLYVAANGPQMLKLAATHGDGVMLSDISPGHIDATLATLRGHLGIAGRSNGDFRVNNVIAWHIKASREAAYREARTRLWVRGIWERPRIQPYLSDADCELVAGSLQALAGAYARSEDPSPGVIPRRIMDKLADGLTLVGDHGAIDKAVERLLRFRRAGVTEVSLRLYGDPADTIRLVAERVLPGLL